MLNQLFNEDCLDTMAKMPSDFVDLTVTSPPYDSIRKYNGYSFNFEPIARELYRVTKKGGIVVWVVGDQTKNGDESGTSFKQALYFKEIGFKLYDTMIYAKNNPLPKTHRRYEQAFEYMFVFSKGVPETFNPILEPCKYAGNIQSGAARHNNSGKLEIKHGAGKPYKDFKIKYNIWNYTIGAGHSTKYKDAYKHPATFPDQLAHDHISSWSNEGDLVYDPFAGSGTVPAIAISLNRLFVASEISEDYCDIIRRRISPICQ
jgi:DNA modification methylase